MVSPSKEVVQCKALYVCAIRKDPTLAELVSRLTILLLFFIVNSFIFWKSAASMTRL